MGEWLTVVGQAGHNVAVTDSAAPQELVYLIVGLLASVLNLALGGIAISDLKACYNLKINGGKRIEAWTAVGQQGFLVAQQLITISVGVFAVLTPPANPDTPTTALGVYLAFALICKQVLAATQGVYTLWRRKRLGSYMDDETSKRTESNAERRHDEAMQAQAEDTRISTEARDAAVEVASIARAQRAQRE